MISVVVTTYNRKDLLKRCIESLLEQSFKDFEVIIIDDGSSDGTDTYIQELVQKESKIKYIQFNTNQGASAARNYGIMQASGEYVLVWDSDDILYQEALQVLVDFSKQNPNFDVVSTPARIIDQNGQEILFLRLDSGQIFLDDVLSKKIPSNEKIRLVRRELFDSVKYQSRNLDFIVNVELVSRGTWYHLDLVLGDVFNNLDKYSLTRNRRKFNKARSIERSYVLVDFLDRFKKDLIRADKGRYGAYCYGCAAGQFFAGNYKCARNMSFDAIRYGSITLRAFFILIMSFIPAFFSEK